MNISRNDNHQAIEKLKELGNPFYQNIRINNNFMEKDEDDTDIDNFLDNVMDDFEDQQNVENTEDNDGILDAVKQYQSKEQDHTCLMPEEMAGQVVVNSKNVPLNIHKEETNATFKFAPGEGKIVTPWMRAEHFDVKANPRHHPSGLYGLHHPREFPLTPTQYFNQRLMNEDERFSKDSFYVFEFFITLPQFPQR